LYFNVALIKCHTIKLRPFVLLLAFQFTGAYVRIASNFVMPHTFDSTSNNTTQQSKLPSYDGIGWSTVFPHIVSAETILFEFGNPKVTVHKCAETIQGRKLFKGGNYTGKLYLQKEALSVVPLCTGALERQKETKWPQLKICEGDFSDFYFFRVRHTPTPWLMRIWFTWISLTQIFKRFPFLI
jgi:hypothetical protein